MKHGILYSTIRKINNNKKTVHQFQILCCIVQSLHAYSILYSDWIELQRIQTSLLHTTTLFYIVCIAVLASSGRKKILNHLLFHVEETSRLQLFLRYLSWKPYIRQQDRRLIPSSRIQTATLFTQQQILQSHPCSIFSLTKSKSIAVRESGTGIPENTSAVHMLEEELRCFLWERGREKKNPVHTERSGTPINNNIIQWTDIKIQLSHATLSDSI